MSYSNKKEGIIDITKNLDDWASIRDIVREFEKRTNMEVSPQRVHQVVKELSEKKIIEVDQRKLGGNDVNFVRSKRLTYLGNLFDVDHSR